MNDKRLPIGVSEFNEIRKTGYYYVDKSYMIKDVLDSGAKVTLITRPRRFGKTLAMTMVRDFFDVTQDSREIFTGLDIMDTAYADEINTCPVIFLSFKECKYGLKNLLLRVKEALYNVFLKYTFIIEQLQSYAKKDYEDMVELLRNKRTDDFEEIATGIVFMSQMLFEYYHQNVIILIDEYDTPLISAYEGGYYDEIKGLFTNLYGSALKDNPTLKFAVMTGIQRIAKENIFSGLNNLKVCTIMDNSYCQEFGLTEKETETLLNNYGLKLTGDVKQMYNGYHFGETEIYNPWSILNYADNKKLQPYWINSSTNSLVRQLILEADSTFKMAFEKLIADGQTRVNIKLNTSFFELQQIETLWGLLLNTGYITTLNAPEDEFELYEIKIPNKEVKGEFKEIVAQYTGFGESRLKSLFGALVRKDIHEFTRIYQQIIIENTSFHDNRENAYHMLVLGMCVYLEGYYEIKSNIESGYGRSDIMLLAKDKKYVHVIMEFKQGEDIEKLAVEALQQIHQQQYYAGLSGEVLLLGIAHDIKKCQIVSELFCIDEKIIIE